MFSTLITTDDFQRMTLLVLPLVFGGVLHMVAVKLDILSYLKKPIHQRWFGLNKTRRGFLIMPLVTFPGVVVANKALVCYQSPDSPSKRPIDPDLVEEYAKYVLYGKKL
jgi:hypothetical protein